mmetsp:Transcript_30436/g.86810  ORF Transcript_30436/g.86810 Transcript_30436/m.86810 type:complete len:101 (-) Transcript_30436:345-647(-)
MFACLRVALPGLTTVAKALALTTVLDLAASLVAPRCEVQAKRLRSASLPLDTPPTTAEQTLTPTAEPPWKVEEDDSAIAWQFAVSIADRVHRAEVGVAQA